jgi:tetratricopeptide (TPR) repeat protein
VRLANYRGIIGEQRAAEEHMAIALELEPDSPLVLTTFASLAAAAGRFAQAIEMQQRALEVEPLSHASRYNLGTYLFYAGRREEALREMIELRELNPTPQRPLELHGLVHVVEGRFERALEIARDWPAGADQHFIAALANDGLGRREDAEIALQALIEAGDLAEAFRIAEVYAHRGDADRAFEWLRTGEAYASGNMGWRVSGRRPAWLLEYSPLLRPLQADPRWSTSYATARQPRRQAANSPPP